MSLLGKFTKQPVEVEVYSIQFVEDLSATDEIVSTYTIFARTTAASWDQVVKTAPYTALASDDGRILVVTASVTLPTGTEGYRLYVSNQSQSAAISVGAFSVAARESVIVTYSAGAWVREAFTECVMVSSPGDQRVRTFVSGGVVGQTYKAQVAVTTSEGRTLQDEFQLRIKEV